MIRPQLGPTLSGKQGGWDHRSIHLWLYQQTGIAVRGPGLAGHYEHHLEIGWWILDNRPDAPDAPPFDEGHLGIGLGHAERHIWEIDQLATIQENQ